MSLLFFDGFDGYDTGTDLTNFGGWLATAEGSLTLSSTVRVGSGKSLQVGYSGTEVLPYKFAADQSTKTVYIGYSFYRSHSGNGTAILYTLDSAKSIQIQVKLNTSNILELRDIGGTVLATGTTVLSLNTHYWLEFKIKIANAGGIFDCKLEGATEFTYSGDTQWRATDSFLYIFWTCNAPMQHYIIDDVYICNSDGSVNNTYLGEQRAELITPESDNTIAWTRFSGATNAASVDDAIGAPDDNSTYVYSSTTAQKDIYNLTTLSNVSTVAGVKLVTRAEKDDANPISFKHGIKSGGTDQQITYALGVGYANFMDIFETSDGASTAFTTTTIDSLLSTIEVV